MNQFKYIIFDWDGTIAQTLPIWLIYLKDYFKKFGLNLNDTDIKTQIIGHFTPFLNPDSIDTQDFQKQSISFFQSYFNEIELYPNVEETINNLFNQGIRLAIASTSSRFLIDPVLERFQLGRFFSFCLSIENIVKPKPNPEILNLSLEKFSASNEEVLFIGDALSDLRAGKAAGIKTAFYYPTINQQLYQLKDLSFLDADLVIDDFSQILALVN
jgi:pyrophosphatase PpaX